MTDKKQILDNLMEHGKTTGKLTTKEITDALEKLDYDVEQMDSFYDSCAANRQSAASYLRGGDTACRKDV